MRKNRKLITFPCMTPVLVPAEKVVANDYNPNQVAAPEMELLAISLEEDGVTQAIVVYCDAESDRYVIVDGFNRFVVLTRWFRCTEIPVVIIDKPLAERMASTIRHNRARGKHRVDMMAILVEKLIGLGVTDSEIAHGLGMEAEEVMRLRQTTGIAGAFAGRGYSRAWVRVNGEESQDP